MFILLLRISLIMLYGRRFLCDYLSAYVSWTLYEPNPCISWIYVR